MIRVFVVDDEKLVRRGIIGLIDWEKYGMEVVGDSGNSQETLEFLKREEVDLLFSDLEMPGLSGVPFLQEVKKVRPEIQIVVLTMHQEFELIQQSLLSRHSGLHHQGPDRRGKCGRFHGEHPGALSGDCALYAAERAAGRA